MSGRLVLLTSTHRVPAGVLSWPAWALLREADAVLLCDSGHPLAPHLAAAGVTAEVIGSAPDFGAGPDTDVEAGPDTDPAKGTDKSTEPEDQKQDPDRELAAVLLRRAHGATVVWVAGEDGEAGLGRALADVRPRWAGPGEAPDVEVLAGSWDLPGARLLDLVAVLDRLRSPGGCPWDAEQTHASLLRYLLEEAYETVEAVEAGDRASLREELGDVLLQVVFHARIAAEDAELPFTVDDVATGIVDKLVSRHPHVFGRAEASTAAAVEVSWEALKAAEKGRTSAVDGVPLAQPALALADKLISRASRAGVAASAPDVAALDVPADAAAYGDLLLGLVAAGRDRGIDAEAALRAAARRYAERVRATETRDAPLPTR